MISNSTRVRIDNNSVNNTDKKNNNPNFRGLGNSLMNLSGWAMNGIENGGFVASFLIQDTAGMTFPRTREGLYRDRDKKKTSFKDLNFKEAAEVFIREFLSGPLMMFTPFAVFALTKKFLGKSTFTNTNLLKGLGKQFTEVVKNKKTADTAKNLKDNFYRSSIRKMLEQTTPNGANSPKLDETVERIFKYSQRIDSLESYKLKGYKRQKAVKNQIAKFENKITKVFNDFHKENSTNFDLVNKVKVGDGTFNSINAVNAMRGYAYDILKSKNVSELTEQTAKNFEKQSMVKRVFSTVAASLATIGSTSIVPSLYAILNPVPPGALESNSAQQTKPSETQQAKPVENNNKKGSLAFKGNILRQLQFDGNQLTPMLMMTLAGGGLIAPRVNTAVKRAPVDKETGKKNFIEIPEILTRDVISTAAVTFGVPFLTKAMVKTYEYASGFVLGNRKKGETSGFKKALDMINPLSSVGPYSNKDIYEIYGNIDNKAKLSNFAQFINENDGSLVKVFKRLKNGKSSFAGTVADFDTIANLDRKTSNSKIIEVITNHFDENSVKKLLEPDKVSKNGKTMLNGMLKRARDLNSMPRAINTLFLVPAFLGVILPRIVYGVTAKNRKKMEAAQKTQGKKEFETPINNTRVLVQNINKSQKSFGQNNNTFDKLKHKS